MIVGFDVGVAVKVGVCFGGAVFVFFGVKEGAKVLVNEGGEDVNLGGGEEV